MSNPLKKLAGQTAIYGLSSIVGRLLNYLLVPLHTSAVYGFEKAQYGIISEYYAFVAFFIVLLTFGMETTFFRFVNKAENKEKTFNQATTVVLILSILFFALSALFSQSIASWMGYPNQQNFVLWFAAILSIDAVSSMFLAKLRYQEKAKKFAFVQLSSIACNIGLNVIFILGFYDPSNPGASIGIGFVFLANLVASAVKPVFMIKEVISYRFVWDKVMTKTMIAFAFPLAIAGFAGIVNETLDRIMIKRLLMGDGLKFAQEQVGIYSANYKLSILITLFIQAFRYAAEPFFFSKEKDEDAKQTYAKVMNYFVIVCSILFLGIMLFIDLFKYFIPNESYWEGLTIVPILLLANISLGIYYNQSIWYKLSGKTQYGAYIGIIGALITITLNYALIPSLGYLGSAWTTLICYVSMMLLSFGFSRKHYPIKYNLPKIFFYIGLSVGIYYLSTLFIVENPVAKYGIYSVFFIGFIALSYLLERPKKVVI